ncbi:MAG: hypothetical protein ABIO83_01290 [Ilumatobacteraceae bacterium]
MSGPPDDTSRTTEEPMLVLVATNDTQGDIESDHAHTVEGELVTPVTIDAADPGTCGCSSGFSGLASGRCTTTAVVTDRPGITDEVLGLAVRDALDRSGGPIAQGHELFDTVAAEHVEAIGALARAFQRGSVVRRDGHAFWADIRRGAA